MELSRSHWDSTTSVPTQQIVARHPSRRLNMGMGGQQRCNSGVMILIPTLQTLIANLRFHQQTAMRGRVYWASGVLFPNLWIATSQPSHPGSPSALPSVIPGKITLLLTPNQPSHLRPTGGLSSPLLFAFLLFSFTSFLLLTRYIPIP